MTIQPAFFVDLDDTMFQTFGKCPTGVAEADLTIAATASNGKHSFMTPAQKAFFDWLSENAVMIPVTARSSRAYAGLHIVFKHGAVLTNGMRILKADGSTDEEWQETISADLAPYQDVLKEIVAVGEASARSLGLDLRCFDVGEHGLRGYACFKDRVGDGLRMGELDFGNILEGTDWTLHHNGNNLAIIPPVISKRRAVEYLIAKMRETEPNKPTLGFGDSSTDLPFMGICDMMGIPSRSQIVSKYMPA